MNRTVVMIHPGALGDVLLAVPAMRRIRSRCPAHELVLCANRAVAQVLFESRMVDAWLPMEGRAAVELFGRAPAVSEPLAGWLKRCDLAAAWMQDEEGRLAEALSAGGATAVHACSPFSPALRSVHQSDRFLEAINESPEGQAGPVPFAIPDSWRTLGQSHLRRHGVVESQRLIVLHPGSGSVHKCVGPNVLVPVIERLNEEGLKPVVLEGPADREAVTWLCKRASAGLTVIREMDLRTLVGLLAHARVYVGQDSGVTHLAASFGVQTVALFGPTDPARWAPRGAHVEVIRGGSCVCRSWDEVRRCAEKPCLRISAEAILACCFARCSMDITPRNPSLPALSPSTSYVRVAS